MASLDRRLGYVSCLLLAFGAVACGPQFDPASNLSTLRILAVKADDPYVRVSAPSATDAGGDGAYQPDNVVDFTVALDDSRHKSDRLGSPQKLWFAGCSNPPGDTYFSCILSVWLTFKAYDAIGPKPLADGQTWGLADANTADVLAFVMDAFPDLANSASAGTAAVDQAQLIEQAMALRIGAGDTFRYEVPKWLIERHPPSSDPDIPRYGLSEVYFAVCDGTIALSDNWKGTVDPFEVLTDATKGFPLKCIDPKTEEQRGPDNFMVSYSNVYAYEKLSNKNPVIQGVKLEGDALDNSASCSGKVCELSGNDSALCLGVSCDLEVDACKNPLSPSVKRCTKKASDCPTVKVIPMLEKKDNAEEDVTATVAGSGGKKLLEQMWIRYYSDRGDIKNEAKRLQDANEGWFADYGTEWTVPRTVGSAKIWTVVYDNRGGVDWARTSVCVKD